MSIAGDAAKVEPQIIIGAQESGLHTYHNRIRAAMSVYDERPAVAKSTREPTALATYSFFASSRKQVVYPVDTSEHVEKLIL